jgi:hypothetical protein
MASSALRAPYPKKKANLLIEQSGSLSKNNIPLFLSVGEDVRRTGEVEEGWGEVFKNTLELPLPEVVFVCLL